MILFNLLSQDLGHPDQRTDAVSYAEVFADFVAFPGLDHNLKKLFRGRFHHLLPIEDRSGAIRGILFGTGRSALQSKLYSKPTAADGDDGRTGEPVTRLEFILRDVRARKFPSEPEAFLTAVPSIWRRLCREQLHLHRIAKCQAARWPRVAWWESIVGEAFGGDGPEGAALVPDDRSPDPDHLWAGATGALASFAEVVFGEDRGQARALLRERLFGMLRDLFTDSTDD